MSAESDPVRLEIDGTIAVVTLHRPERKNALSKALVDDLLEVVHRVEETSARVVILRGAEGTFSAGGDLEQPPDEFVDEVSASIDAIEAIRSSSRPYVAAIEGAAVGGGLELALGCDLRIAGSDARLGLPETSVGIFPCAGGTRLLPRLIGSTRANELLLTGRLISGDRADDWGLVNRAVDDADVMDTAREFAETIASNSPRGIEATLRSTNDAFERSVIDGTRWDEELARTVAHHPDFEEGKTAFLDGRSPTFEDP
ncbi:enoyl-CoA hydratase/isomerase family protein [Natrarchaeobius oligotrophus]|uniref:Enoyl-CoA hydratase/isomerase family protein n=1 Tax=Natrarchaeobius chitinivorans TaxID=1679083 RepID=A0A3N6MPA4_NATCH|nr:enoyl-CoA hydratase/isomerase family protein [Natrarchaeobius chitinivorans]RQG99390.1 enoyl-CoA hydratase/isomerase family protein [Natrarchaeobius chitinivorans]